MMLEINFKLYKIRFFLLRTLNKLLIPILVKNKNWIYYIFV